MRTADTVVDYKDRTVTTPADRRVSDGKSVWLVAWWEGQIIVINVCLANNIEVRVELKKFPVSPSDNEVLLIG